MSEEGSQGQASNGVQTSVMGKLSDLVVLARPSQWVKNVFVFPALVFGDRRDEPDAIVLSLLTFAVFCLVSSAVYSINDVLDREEDRLHPVKRHRPIAAGRISTRAAWLLGLGCAVAGLLIGWGVHRAVLVTAVVYIGLMAAYNLWLKDKVIIDVIIISCGFVVRAIAGALALQVAISPWLLVCTFTLCLFLGFGKRECELAAFASSQEAAMHRGTLSKYQPQLLAHLLTASAGIAVVTFLLYTLDPQTQEKFHSNLLIYTTPLVFYGMFRYTMLVQSGKLSGPNEVLLADRAFRVTVLLWIVAAVAIVYWGAQIEERLRDWLGLSRSLVT